MAGGGGGSGFGSGLWIADIEKLLQGEYWTNRYIIEAADMAAALTAANTIVGAERAIHYDNVLFTRYRVSDGVAETDVYQVTNVNLFGSQALGSDHMLPLFNVLRIDFNTAGGGRPSRKYLRGCLTEPNVNFNAIASALVTAVNSGYVSTLVGLASFVDIDGQQITSGAAYPFVGMRQLRRGSKRKTPTPDPVEV